MTCKFEHLSRLCRSNFRELRPLTLSLVADAILPLALWADSELRIGVIVGSIPPCRSFVMEKISQIRTKTRSFSSGRSERPSILSKVTSFLSKSSAGTPEVSQGSYNSKTSRKQAEWVDEGTRNSSIVPLTELPEDTSGRIVKTVGYQVHTDRQ